MRHISASLILLICSATILYSQTKQPREFRSWPAGASPQEIGKRVANNFVSRAQIEPTYPATCTFYGSLTFAQLSGDKELTSRIIQRFDALLTPENLAMLRDKQHVDFSVFGAAPLEIYIQTKQARYLEAGKSLADHQWNQTTPEGLTSETRFWIDDMYMITILQVQAYRATGDAKYLDRAAHEMTAYLDKLQQPNGLFLHAPDVPFYWGRGNGWVATGMTELLRSLSKNHPQRPRILAAYRKMLASLLKYQGGDGMWRQLIDRPESWPESSSTAMFAFAMITGVKNGWLDKKAYAPAARKAWLGLASYLDADGNVKSVCEGTGKKNDYQYYLDRKRITGDIHGQAPILWCASALLR